MSKKGCDGKENEELECHRLIKEKCVIFFFTGNTKALKQSFTNNTKRINWNRYTYAVCHIAYKCSGWPLKSELHT